VSPETRAALPPVTVTGGAGYVGSVVVRDLLRRGHAVRVLDNFLYRDDTLQGLPPEAPLEIVRGDIRAEADLDRAFAGVPYVLHLAGLVGDPACALDPAWTRAVNQESSHAVADACRRHGVSHLVFASTCSVYGAAGDAWLTEDSPTAPVSLYAETNLRAEEILARRLERSGTALTILRFATIFGVSPRMRFDLVVNLLTARAATEGGIEVHGGEQWRPQVHVEDVADALRASLERANGAVRVWNVGGDEQNFRVRELAEHVARAFPGLRVAVADVRDPRSYRVSFARIASDLGWRPRRGLDHGIREVAGYLAERHPDTASPLYHNERSLLARRAPA
jgi:nucleoside-diphosphate-sugar epimerase